MDRVVDNDGIGMRSSILGVVKRCCVGLYRGVERMGRSLTAKRDGVRL